VQSWDAEQARQRSNAWHPPRPILNDAGARMPEHHCRIPVRARIVWGDEAGEEFIETMALGWSGSLVYVDMHGTGYGLNAVWLDAADVTRR
jgi:hypothetical protein